jgi:hypothetical protein
VSGQFVSPDSVQGNAQGMDPYAYVEGNPETWTDPTGQRDCVPNGDGIECGNPGGGGGTYCYEGDCNGGGSGDCSGGTKASAGMCGSGGSSNLCPSGMQLGKGGCVYDSGTCKGLTVPVCNTGKQKQADKIEWLKHLIGLLTMALGLGTAIFDILAAIKDFKEGAILVAIGDILNVLGDIGTILAGLASVLDWNGLSVFAGFVSAGVNMLSGVYQLVRNTGWGLQFLKIAGQAFINLFFAANPTSLLVGLGAALLYQFLTQDLSKGLKGGLTGILKGAIDATQATVNIYMNESIAQYCAGTETCD